MSANENTNTPTTTTVGSIDDEVLAYTAGKDVVLDQALVEVDCLGTAAHVTMLAEIPVDPPLLTPDERDAVLAELRNLVAKARAGNFEITLADQDVHLAVERQLTESLGDLGKKVHTARSRNDQVALDLRLHARDELAGTIREVVELAAAFNAFGDVNAAVPMVGRTHMQPAMPSSVGLWATAQTEGLLDDLHPLLAAAKANHRSPLGSAAGYGVPLPIDRQRVSDLLHFDAPVHNVLYASIARGKIECIILQALGQVMLTLSRVAQDLMLYTLPEFAYFRFPAAFGTGSSIMPNKNNPDVLELIRGKTSVVLAHAHAVENIIKSAPSGYNRDLQEAKEAYMEGLRITRASLRVLTRLVEGLEVNEEALVAGFTPGVFATDRALELVAGGMPFRDAYHHVKNHLDELEAMDPRESVGKKTHLGGTAGLDFAGYRERLAAAGEEAAAYEQASAAAWQLLA